MRIHGCVVPALCGVLFAPGLATAQVRVILDSTDATLGFGIASRMLDDLDGDGRREFIVGTRANSYTGAVSVRFGKDGTELRQHVGEQASDSFGTVLELLADVNGDGIGDYVVSAPDFDTAQDKNAGKLYVYSGADGASLWTLAGVGHDKRWATNLAAVGDANGDAATDFVVNKLFGGAAFGGRLQLLSGKDGTPLWTVDAPHRDMGLGMNLARVADVDGDGVGEVAAWVPSNGIYPNQYGGVVLYSGASGTLIWSRYGSPGEEYGESIADVEDVNGDGIHDVAIGVPGRNNAAGAIEIRSGRNGHKIAEHDSAGPQILLGSWISAGFDADGDGDPDFIASVGPKFSVFDAGLGAKIADLVVRGFYTIDPAGDFDGDGFDDFLYSTTADFDGFGHAKILTFRSPPAVASVAPPRGDHHLDTAVTIAGSGFLLAQSIQVNFGASAASNVAVVDDATITCAALADVPGPVDVTVTTDAGSATLTNGFARTPATVLEGDEFLGGSFTERSLCDSGDTLLGLVGLAPEVSIPLPPFEGNLCIAPFVILFLEPNHATDEKDLVATIPNDPSLSGLEILFQSLVGPQLSGHGKSGSWTNCAHLKIQ
jgi:hypothetical protein